MKLGILFFVLSFYPVTSVAANQPADGYTAPIEADTLPSASSTTEIISPRDTKKFLMPQRFEVGLTVLSQQYKEPRMRDQGTLAGAAGAFNWHTANEKTSLRIAGDYAEGSYKYHGETWGGEKLQMNGKEKLLNIRFVSGPLISISPKWLLHPYYGLAERYLQTNDEGAGSYKREITYLYVPVGVSSTHSLSKNLKLEGKLEGDLLLAGTVKSYFGASDPTANNTTNNQSRGYSVRSSVAASLRMGGTIASIEPYFSFWRVEDSNYAQLYKDSTQWYVVEPHNETITAGATASVLF